MFRKIIIIYVTLIPDSAIKSKAVLVLFFIAVSFYFHSKSKPYTNENLNKLEFNAILVSMATIFFGMFYLSDIDTSTQAIIFTIIIFSNVFFLFKWTLYVIMLSFRTLTKSTKMKKCLSFANSKTFINFY